eukprot:UN01260
MVRIQCFMNIFYILSTRIINYTGDFHQKLIFADPFLFYFLGFICTFISAFSAAISSSIYYYCANSYVINFNRI